MAPQDSNGAQEIENRARALSGAELMLAYAAEKGIALSPDDVGAVLAYKQASAEGPDKVPPEVEAAFWVSTSRLAAKIQPSTIEALRARAAYEIQGRSSPLGRVARGFAVAIWFILVVTIFVHAYQASIERMIQSAETALNRIQEVRNSLANISYPDTFQIGGDASERREEQQVEFVESIEALRLRYCSNVREFLSAISNMNETFPSKNSFTMQLIVGKITQDDAFLDYEQFGKGDECNREYVENKYRGTIGKDRMRSELLSKDIASNLALDLLQDGRSTRAVLAQFVLPLLYGLLDTSKNLLRALLSH
jgi:hypothetical protein